MALVKGSAIVGQISGVVGGVEFASGRAGMIAKAARRPRPHRTAAEAEVTNLLGDFHAAWRAWSPEGRAAWAAYAAQVNVTNRFGGQVNITGVQACIQYMTYVRSWVGRGSGPGGVVLQFPPPRTDVAYDFIQVGATFSASGAYTILAYWPQGPWSRLWFSAARMCTARWTGSTNMRYIDSVAYSGITVDVRAKFNGAPINWVFQEGERVHLVLQGLGYNTAGWPNFPRRVEVVVGP